MWPPPRSASNLLSCPSLFAEDARRGISLLGKTSSCCFRTVWGLVNGGGKPDTPGNSAVLEEVKRWEETPAPSQVINRFYCRLHAGAGRWGRQQRGQTTEMRSPQTA